MTLRSRLASLWLTWKYVALLALALAASLYGNYRQFRAAIEAPLRDRIEGQKQALDDSAALLADQQASAAALNAAAAKAAAALNKAGADYRRAAREHPLGQGCAPGADRMNAVNRAMGAPEPTP